MLQSRVPSSSHPNCLQLLRATRSSNHQPAPSIPPPRHDLMQRTSCMFFFSPISRLLSIVLLGISCMFTILPLFFPPKFMCFSFRRGDPKARSTTTILAFFFRSPTHLVLEFLPFFKIVQKKSYTTTTLPLYSIGHCCH